LPAYADAPRTHSLLSVLCVVLVSWWEQLLLLAAGCRPPDSPEFVARTVRGTLDRDENHQTEIASSKNPTTTRSKLDLRSQN
jgi:hypothetical protein